MKPTKKASEMTLRELASYIDQSVLKPEFTQDDIRKYIQEGIDRMGVGYKSTPNSTWCKEVEKVICSMTPLMHPCAAGFRGLWCACFLKG